MNIFSCKTCKYALEGHVNRIFTTRGWCKEKFTNELTHNIRGVFNKMNHRAFSQILIKYYSWWVNITPIRINWFVNTIRKWCTLCDLPVWQHVIMRWNKELNRERFEYVYSVSFYYCCSWVFEKCWTGWKEDFNMLIVKLNSLEVSLLSYDISSLIFFLYYYFIRMMWNRNIGCKKHGVLCIIYVSYGYELDIIL